MYDTIKEGKKRRNQKNKGKVNKLRDSYFGGKQ